MEGWINDTVKYGTYFDENIIEQNSIKKESVLFAYRYFRIFMRLYRIFSINNKILDKIFINEKIHKKLLKILPLANLIVFPLKAPYKFIYKNFPNTSKFIKTHIIDNLRGIKNKVKTPTISIKENFVDDFYY